MLAFVAALVMGALPVMAQTRSVFWERWDVFINEVDTTANRFRVTESYEVSFTGSFRFGTAVIPLDRVERIDDIRVSDGGRPMQRACTQLPGTFCVARTAEGQSITYYFFEPVNNGRRKIELSYTVYGALRIYPDGDQLWWDAIPSEHYGFSIGRSTVTVELPSAFAPREGIDPVVTYGVPATITVNGSVITAVAQRALGGNDYLSIRVQYPHDPNARKPAWQDAFDRQRDFDENVRPLLDLGVIGAAIALGLGGSLLVFARYRTHGRDPEIGPVPTYLAEPPSALPPAVVGTLLDERADLRDVMSTLIDLSSRGYLVIEENRTEGLFGIGVRSEFTFKRTDKPLDDLRPFERTLMNNVFSGQRMERTLDSMRNVFYTVIPRIQRELYQEMVKEGFFTEDPNTTRSRWGGMAALLLFGAVAGFVILIYAEVPTPSLLCLPAALGLVGLTTLMLSSAMPRKTRKGAEEAAKWRAFEEYMRNLERYGGLEAAKARFDQYLAYAVAFGIDRTWLRRFTQFDDLPIPPWYYPTYMGGPYRRPYLPGSPLPRVGGDGGLPGELARAGEGGFSLETVSGNIAQGLESFSNGLSTMLESASRVMTSRPQQASGSGRWSSGGRSWSGGGFSGGGGSGGGSRGFG